MKKASKNQWIYTTGLVLSTIIFMVVVTATTSQSASPVKWAKQARLETVVVGGADAKWTQLTSRISESEREGQDLNQLLDIVERRPDNTGELMPIPYRQWLKEQTDPWWLSRFQR